MGDPQIRATRKERRRRLAKGFRVRSTWFGKTELVPEPKEDVAAVTTEATGTSGPVIVVVSGWGEAHIAPAWAAAENLTENPRAAALGYDASRERIRDRKQQKGHEVPAALLAEHD